MSLPPANWYADPWDPAKSRYWDGAAWTGHTQATGSPSPEPVAPVAPAAQRDDERYDAIGGRILSPAYGHVMTPGVEPEPLLVSTPYRRAPRRSAGKLLVKIVVGVVIFLAAGAGVKYALTEILGPRTEAAAPLTPSIPVAPATIPAGWGMHTSRSGAVTYARNPSWTDAYTVELERSAFAVADTAGGTLELAGVWTWGGADPAATTVLQVIVGTLPGNTEGAREAAIGFSGGASAMPVGTDEVQTLNASFDASDRYDAWRIDSTFSTAEGPLYSSLIALGQGDSAVMVYCLSRQNPSEWNDDMVALARSVTLVGPAQDL